MGTAPLRRQRGFLRAIGTVLQAGNPERMEVRTGNAGWVAGPIGDLSLGPRWTIRGLLPRSMQWCPRSQTISNLMHGVVPVSEGSGSPWKWPRRGCENGVQDGSERSLRDTLCPQE